MSPEHKHICKALSFRGKRLQRVGKVFFTIFAKKQIRTTRGRPHTSGCQRDCGSPDTFSKILTVWGSFREENPQLFCGEKRVGREGGCLGGFFWGGLRRPPCAGKGTSPCHLTDKARMGHAIWFGPGPATNRMPHRVRILPGTLTCLLYTSPSPRDAHESRMPSSA